MLNEDNCWIPDLVTPDSLSCGYDTYLDELYSIFKADFIDSRPKFRGLPVMIRKYPMEYGKEEAFFHITCKDFQKKRDRSPDFRRSERIKWCRTFIENYLCSDYACTTCDGIKVWDEPHKNTFQTCLLSEESRYIVVLEKRNSYYLLITAYYIDYDHTLKKKLAKYEAYALR